MRSLVLGVVILMSCASPSGGLGSGRVLGELIIHPKTSGWPDSISGLAYHAPSGEFVAVSDERELQEAFYLRIEFTGGGKLRVEVLRARVIEPPGAGGSDGYPDHEDIAVFSNGDLIIASERGDTPLKRVSRNQGATLGASPQTIAIPGSFARTPGRGVAHNAGIEAIALSPSEKILALSNEKPLLQSQKGEVVLAFVDLERNRVASEFHYRLDDVPEAGLTALAYLDSQALLALERGWDKDLKRNYGRIYRIDLELDAVGVPRKILPKKLVADLEKLASRMDNFEGMTLGPGIEKGTRAIYLVSDNNSRKSQRTVFLAIALEKPASDSLGASPK